MVRKITPDDKDFFLTSAYVFYHSDALEKPLSDDKYILIFNELMRSDELIEGFILEYDGKRAGYSVTAKCFQTEAPGLNVWIEDLYILPEYRKRGLGTEFFTFLHDYYGDRIQRFRLEVEPDNAAAVRLYEKQGFRLLPYAEMEKSF